MGDTTKNFCSIPSLVRPGSCSCLDASLRVQNSDWAMIMMHISFLLTWTLFIVFLLPQRSLATSHWFLKKPRLITNFWIIFSCIHFHFPTRVASFFASVVWDAWGRLSSLVLFFVLSLVASTAFSSSEDNNKKDYSDYSVVRASLVQDRDSVIFSRELASFGFEVQNSWRGSADILVRKLKL